MCTYTSSKPMRFLLVILLIICHLNLQCCVGFAVSSVNSRCRHIATSLGAQIIESAAGDLEKLKAEEAKLASMLASIRKQKLDVLRGAIFDFVICFCVIELPRNYIVSHHKYITTTHTPQHVH